MGGKSVLYTTSDSLSKLLANVYPEYEWLPWRFSKCPQNYWGDVNNQKKFVNWAGKELKIKELSDWYKVTNQVEIQLEKKKSLIYKELSSLGGKALIPLFGNMLSNAYPEYEWLPWKFAVHSQNFWNDKNNQRKFMDWAGKQLNIKEPSDWYNVSIKVFNKANVFCLLFRTLLILAGNHL